MDNYDDIDQKILDMYKNGLSNTDIAKALRCSTNTVWRHLKKHNILRLSFIYDIDWAKIQELYNSGLSETDLRIKKYATRTQIEKAKASGLLLVRNKNEMLKLVGKKISRYKRSDEEKKNLSDIMIKRHKDGTAYTLGHNERLKKRSYPEQWFETVIQNEIQNKEYISQYPLGRYCLDFAWTNEKKCIEVDGETHYRFQAEVDKDIKRDTWLIEQGWSILRFRWKDVQRDKKKYILILKRFIDGEDSLMVE